MKSIPVFYDAESKRDYIEELLKNTTYLNTPRNIPVILTGKSDILEAQITILITYPNIKFIITTLGAQGSILIRKCSTDKHNKCIKNVTDLLTLGTSMKELEVINALIENTSYELYYCTALKIKGEDIIDTTGCGDTFIGACVWSIMNNLPIEKMLKLGSYLAGSKTRVIGARTGILKHNEIPKELIE